MNIQMEIFNRMDFSRRPDWQVDLGIAAGCIVGYLFAWFCLLGYSYPAHWIGGVMGALIGGLVGWSWFRLRERKINGW